MNKTLSLLRYVFIVSCLTLISTALITSCENEPLEGEFVVDGGTIDDTKGTVTFTARSMVNGTPHTQTENSLFKKKAGRWYYVSEVR